jgi:hypothetical protein
MIADALDKARTELEALRSRERELEDQIAEAEAMIGVDSPESGARTLHDALRLLLEEGDNMGMTAHQLAAAVNDRGLYRKRDGSKVDVNQIQARVHNYAALFEKHGALIRLRRESALLEDVPKATTVFRDDDTGFHGWLDAQTDGYFLNAERNPKPTYLVLHRAGCSHFDRSPAVRWTHDYVKVCATDREALETWATDSVGGEVTLCRTCFG